MNALRSRLAISPRRWLLHAVRGALIALAVVIGLIAAFAVVGPNFGYTYAVVKSGSMTPAYPPGSVILIDDVRASSVGAGDVISYRAPGQGSAEIITHRVLEVRAAAGGLEFVTKGDANEDPDSRAVPASDVRGRVLLGVPWVGALAALLQQRGLFFGVVLICGLLIMGMELRNIVREVRRTRRERRGAVPGRARPAPAPASPWVPPWVSQAQASTSGASSALGGRWVRSTALGIVLAMVLFWTMPHVSAQFTDRESTSSNPIPMRTYGTLGLTFTADAAGSFDFTITPEIVGNAQITGCNAESLSSGGSWTCELLRPEESYAVSVVAPVGVEGTWDASGSCGITTSTSTTADVGVTLTQPEPVTCSITFTAVAPPPEAESSLEARHSYVSLSMLMDSEASGPFEFAVTSAKPGNADSSGCSSFTLEPGESRICGLFHSTDPYLITVQAPVGLFGTWSVAGGCTLEEGTNESTLQASLLVSGPTAAACAVTFTPDDE